MDGATVLTEKFTVIETVLVPAVTRMLPCMVPADNPAALAETVKVLDVPAVDAKLKLSQLAVVVAVKVVATLLVKVTGFDSGAVPPIVWLKDKDEGNAVRD